jgi:hypothetical protein
MNLQEAIQEHRQACDQIYELALEENRFIQEHHRAPDAAFLEKKKGALAKLEAAMKVLHAAGAKGPKDAQIKAALQKTQARIMQILQLDKETEVLLTRFSLSRGMPAPAPTPERRQLEKIYSQGPK